MNVDRLLPARRPPCNAAGYQQWRELSFLHWRVPPDTLRPLLPGRLQVDTFDGEAWVALVPFRMQGVRPWWFPAVPLVSRFPETNVRTYVLLDGEPGVWFFSLEASCAPAVRIARWRWHLPYFHARMSVERSNQCVRYRSRRTGSGEVAAESDVAVEIGNPLPGGRAARGTLEHFFAERYVLFTAGPGGRILRGQVHHPPYPLSEATVPACRETLLHAAGLDVGDRPPEHALFSPGVDVEIFPLEPV